MLISAAIDYFGLAPYLEHKCGELSAGWRRRVALSRLLFCPAKLWLLDEPISNLDAEGVTLVNGLIKTRTSGSGGGVVMAAHGVEANIDNDVKFQVIEIIDFIDKAII